MALIWRGSFETEDEAFVRNAVPQVEAWLRWKLRDDQVRVPEDGSLVEHAAGREITGRSVQDGDLSAFRAVLFERRDNEELRTTVTALYDGVSSWAWVDLERWSADAFLEAWVPIAPAVVGTLLGEVTCRRGPSHLTQEIEVAAGAEGGAVARQIVDSEREQRAPSAPSRRRRSSRRQSLSRLRFESRPASSIESCIF